MQKFTYKVFDGGMMSAIDPKERPPTAATLMRNVDQSSRTGKVLKPPGVSAYTFGGELPLGALPNNEQILSTGRLVYNKVWNDAGTEKINQLWELVVIQFNGEHGFDWYELTRQVGTETWDLSAAYYCDLGGGTPDSSFTSFENWGCVKAGKIRWSEMDGVLRGACGAFFDANGISDSRPIQFRYVNRFPAEDADPTKNKGFFQIYDSADANTGDCVTSYHGLWRGRSLPDYSVFPMSIVANNFGYSYYYTHDDIGYKESAKIEYAVLHEYDGHQISALKTEPLSNTKLVLEGADYCWVSKLKVIMIKLGGVWQFPERMTALNVYSSVLAMDMVSTGFPTPPIASARQGSYGLIQKIDLKDGVENWISAIGVAANTQANTWTLTFDVGFNYNETSANMAADLWKNFFVKITFTDGTSPDEEYKITGFSISTLVGTGNMGVIFFTALAPSPATPHTNLTAGASYLFKVNSRWYLTDTTHAEIVILDTNQMIASAPPWLIQGLQLSRQPKIECNYTKDAFIKGRHIVFGVAYDDEDRPTMARSSYPIGHPFAGFDLFPIDILPQIKDDDSIIGACIGVDRLYFFTKKKIISRYITETDIELIADFPWDCGLSSIDGVMEYNGQMWFWGRENNKRSIYVWDQATKPRPVGDRILDIIDQVLALPNCREDLTVVSVIEDEDKGIFSIPFYRIEEDVPT